MNTSKSHDTSSGPLIMIDGPDGVGKTTQIKQLAETLRAAGHAVYTTRLSGGTEIGEKLRKISLNPSLKRSPKTDLYIILAMYSALADDLRIRRAVGDICIVDRSPLSIIAYQVYGSGLPMEEGQKAVEAAFALFKPDLTICYEASEADLVRHIHKRADKQADYFEAQPIEFSRRVIEGYRAAVQMFDAVAVDAEGSKEAVHQKTMELITGVLR